MVELGIGLQPQTEASPIAIAQPENASAKRGNIGETLKRAREVGKQQKGEGLFSKAIKSAREGIRASMDIARGMKMDASLRAELRADIDQKMIEARKKLNEKYEAIRDKADQKREALVMGTRTRLNEIAEKARGMGQSGVDVVAGGAYFAADSGKAVGRAAVGAAEATAGAVRTGVENTVNVSKATKEALSQYYQRTNKKVEASIKAGGADLAGSWFKLAAQPDRFLTRFKVAMGSKLIEASSSLMGRAIEKGATIVESGSANYESAEAALAKAAQCKSKAAEFRNMGATASV